ncbi:MAG TPA: RNA methyltransferase, partial [Candidatus Thermoplasmatota archaeon]|nr:RNA methyltransferase [Candidatus Thermoplasmatota archaeon]
MQPPAVILVGPQHPGNVGASARGAANFGCADFRIVAPECDVRSDEALSRALHAKGLLENAKVYPTLKKALEGTSLSIGTTARTARAVNHFLRKPVDIRDALEPLAAFDGKVAWVFGREDSGLTGAEVDLLDQLVTIPTAEYWSLNLSHAVTLCLYEHFRLQARSI